MIETNAAVTAAVKDKVKQRKCIMLPEVTMMENSSLVDDQRNDSLPPVDLFLNPARKKELDHITSMTIERARAYFSSVDMEKVYPALFRLLWPSTLLCPQMISACSLAGKPHNCSLLFNRYRYDGISKYCTCTLPRGMMYWVVHPRRPRDFPRPEICPEGEARVTS